MAFIALHIMIFFKTPNHLVLGIFLFCLSFLIAYRMIPVIIATLNFKNIHEQPNVRSSHLRGTPSLGGVSFFGSLMISLFFMRFFDMTNLSFHIMAAATVLFFMGLKDDLMVLTSKAKVILQTIAIFFILLDQEMWLTNFHGFLGITELPFWVSIPLTYFTILYLINSFNLIDGIDGLAGMLGIIISTIYTVIFYSVGLYYFFFIGLVVIGFLLAFLKYNLSDQMKIFMGDTGSMITGLLLAIMTLQFLALSDTQLQKVLIRPENTFIVTLSILFFPVIDVLRVIVMRLINKRGPFVADRCHLHHIFIDKGLKHKTASITITLSSILVFAVIYFLNFILDSLGLFIAFVLMSVITFYILLLLDKDASTQVRRKKVKSYIPRWIYEIEFRIRKSIIVFLKKVFYKNLL